MSNTITPSGKEGFATDVDWTADTIKIVLLSASYVYNETDDFLDDVTGIVATSGALIGKSASLGVLDATDVTFTSVAGNPITQGFYYKDTGVAATSRLLIYFSSAFGIIYTPNGGNINFVHADGADKIAAL